MVTLRDARKQKPRKPWPRIVGTFAVGGLLAVATFFTQWTNHPPFNRPGALAQLDEPPIGGPLAPVSREAARIANMLLQHTRDGHKATRIANAVVRESQKRQIDPALLVGVMLTEDDNLDTMAKSFKGARGLMQVMPFHSGQWGCESPNLFGVESNICHGVSILADNLKNSPSVQVALLRYNGCVRGTNTPDCHTYPRKVLRRAGIARGVLAAD
jgi:hypothetical protein